MIPSASRAQVATPAATVCENPTNTETPASAQDDYEICIPSHSLRHLIDINLGLIWDIDRVRALQRWEYLPIKKSDALKLKVTIVPRPLRDNASWKIGNLEGLQFFTNLELLDLWKKADVRHDITSEKLAPISQLTSLKQLFLPFNSIDDLTPLKALVNLVDLNLHDNKVVDIAPLAVMTKLEDLNLTKNKIKDISKLPALAQLQSLSLAENEISDISVLSGLTNIKNLNLHSNKIIDISHIGKLSTLTGTLFHSNTGTHLVEDQIFDNPIINHDGTKVAITSTEDVFNSDAVGLKRDDNPTHLTLKKSWVGEVIVEFLKDHQVIANAPATQFSSHLKIQYNIVLPTITPDLQVNYHNKENFILTGTCKDNYIFKLRIQGLTEEKQLVCDAGKWKAQLTPEEVESLPSGDVVVILTQEKFFPITGKFTKDLTPPVVTGGGGGGWSSAVVTPISNDKITAPIVTTPIIESPKTETIIEQPKEQEKKEVKYSSEEIYNPAIKDGQCYTRRDISSIFDSETLNTSDEFKKALTFLSAYEMTKFNNVDGYDPYRMFTRQEAAKIFSNFAMNVLCRKPDLNLHTNYEDVANADATLKPYIELAYQLGVMKGHGKGDGKFRPLEQISKAEVNAVLIRMILKSYLDETGGVWHSGYDKVSSDLQIVREGTNYESLSRNDLALMLFRAYKNQDFSWKDVDYFSYVLDKRGEFVK